MVNQDELIYIPGGTYTKGILDENAPNSLKNLVYRENIQVPSFFIGETPVTNEQFQEFVKQTDYKTFAEKAKNEETWKKYSNKERLDHPVICITYEDTQNFAKHFNLNIPTEEAWEYAARGGLDKKLFSWGNEIPKKGEKAKWGFSNEEIGTSQVKTYQANNFGLYDCEANVWEMCKINESLNPLLVPRKGGAWNIEEYFRMELGNLGFFQKEQFAKNTGFRIAYFPTEQEQEFISELETQLKEINKPMIADGGGVKIKHIDLKKKDLTLSLLNTCLYCPNQERSADNVINQLHEKIKNINEIKISDSNLF